MLQCRHSTECLHKHYTVTTVSAQGDVRSLQDMRRQPSRRTSTRSKGSSNVLYAVMALLSELDDYGLRLVAAEVRTAHTVPLSAATLFEPLPVVLGAGNS